MDVNLLGSLVDTRPVYAALAQVTHKGYLPPHAQTFMLKKLQLEIRHLHETADAIKQRLSELESVRPKRAR